MSFFCFLFCFVLFSDFPFRFRCVVRLVFHLMLVFIPPPPWCLLVFFSLDRLPPFSFHHCPGFFPFFVLNSWRLSVGVRFHGFVSLLPFLAEAFPSEAFPSESFPSEALV
jgi:hypothetical protein